MAEFAFVDGYVGFADEIVGGGEGLRGVEVVGEAGVEIGGGFGDALGHALAAAYDLVREANVAIDKGEFRQDDAVAAQKFLATFDRVFAVLEDNDAAKLSELGYGKESALSDSDIEKLVADRQAARKRRDFAASDRIRKELAEHGIILEDSKDGSVRWKRK